MLKEESKAFVDDGLLAIYFNGTSPFTPSGVKDGDFHIKLQRRYKPESAMSGHFTIKPSALFDVSKYTPKTLRDYLQSRYTELMELPMIVKQYGCLIPTSSIGYVRSCMCDCVHKLFETVE